MCSRNVYCMWFGDDWVFWWKNKCVCVFKMCMCFRGDWVFMEYLPLENVYVFWKSVCGSRTVVSENKCVCVLEMCMWFGDYWVLCIFWGKKMCMFFRNMYVFQRQLSFHWVFAPRKCVCFFIMCRWFSDSCFFNRCLKKMCMCFRNVYAF